MTRFEIVLDKPLICECCGATEGVQIRHRNTAYCDSQLNYLIACEPCIQYDNEYFKEMWDEYNSSRM